MTRGQTLAGAVGLASWRVRAALLEYASAPAGGGGITSRGHHPSLRSQLSPVGLNEVGVTDAVLATMWHFGPGGAAYGISARAENNYFGADIAFVDVASSRILLYQAKLAQLNGSDLDLKSYVPRSHVSHLTRRSATVDGVKFGVTGRLAIYQTGYTPYLNRWVDLPTWDLRLSWPPFPPWPWLLPAIAGNARVGKQYYEDVLAVTGGAPCGVLASPVVRGSGPIRTVPTFVTWPWEFDIFHWQQHWYSPLDQPGGGPGRPPWDDEPA